MRFIRPIILGGVGLSLILLLTLSACSDDNEAKPTNSGNGGNIPTNAVNISNLAFDPNSIAISAGTEVTWTNQEAAAHTVTSDDGNFASSGNLGQNDTYSVTFSNPGTYMYHCSLHPSMTGTVTVSQ